MNGRTARAARRLAEQDQADAAADELAHRLARVAAPDGIESLPDGAPVAVATRGLATSAPRCAHLIRTPHQPASLLVARADAGWRCGRCVGTSPSLVIDPTDEHVCDLCRRYAAPGGLTFGTVTVGSWAAWWALCERCESGQDAPGFEAACQRVVDTFHELAAELEADR